MVSLDIWAMAKILLVEDDPSINATVKKWLEFDRHIVEAVDNGIDASEHLRCYKFDVVILDWDLPGRSGLDVCREFRSAGGATPVLMLTGKDGITDKVQGLDSGVDDYLTKPFDMRELSARVRALLRRPSENDECIRSGDLIVDTGNFIATRSGVDLNLTQSELSLLAFLMRNSPQMFSPEALLQRLSDVFETDSVGSVRTQIKRIRQKIDIDGEDSYIDSQRNVGYRFNRPVEK